jgi:hypothetical protein
MPMDSLSQQASAQLTEENPLLQGSLRKHLPPPVLFRRDEVVQL